MQANTGEILKLFVSVQDVQGRVQKNQLTLDEKGIQEDKYYNRDILRSILITSTDSYQLAKENGINMPYGSLGENLLVNFNPYDLPAGQRFQISEAILEISQNCTMCDHLSNIDTKLPELLKNDRGIFAKVVKEGMIKEGDTITFL